MFVFSLTFGSVGLSVRRSVCLSSCLSVRLSDCLWESRRTILNSLCVMNYIEARACIESIALRQHMYFVFCSVVVFWSSSLFRCRHLHFSHGLLGRVWIPSRCALLSGNLSPNVSCRAISVFEASWFSCCTDMLQKQYSGRHAPEDKYTPEDSSSCGIPPCHTSIACFIAFLLIYI